MFDFIRIVTKPLDAKGRKWEVYPEFIVKKSKDLMTRGKAFYAVWDENAKLWTTDENYIANTIDEAIRAQVETEIKNRAIDGERIIVKAKYMQNFSSNKWTEWQKYVKSLPDNYHELDTRIVFSNDEIKKTDYISKKLPYEMKEGSIDAYDEIMSTLYDEEERKKLEWAIGAIISGDSKHIQKFIVLKGAPGTGKSTFLNIVQKLFEGYYKSFHAKALGSNNDSFALEAFKDNPLIAIQHDGDLSRIEDNTRLNQIISHEMMTVNEKFKSAYTASFNSFLFMGTNKPVRITDAKSGIIRRLISVEPSGRTIPFRKYQALMNRIDFELGAIAYHCLERYREMGENYYDKYVALDMIGATNDFFNFVEQEHGEFVKDDKTSLKIAWMRYKIYIQDALVSYPYPMRSFKEELKNYFKEFYERDGNEYSVYKGFIKEKFIYNKKEEKDLSPYKLQFNKRTSLFDEWCKEKGFKAQYANEYGNPEEPWDDCTTTLNDIDTHKLHWVWIPESIHHIRIDFDLKDENGNKSLEKNMEAANSWPPTYAEISKSGGGIHLHYFYDGDNFENLADHFAEDIEIKVSKGKVGCRRMLTKCNDIPIATINSGLPFKEERKKDVIDIQQVKDDKHLHNLIGKEIRKKLNGETSTNQACNFIYHVVEEEAYRNGVSYDIRDMESDIRAFANNSTNHARECVKKMAKMHFCSDDMLSDDKLPSANDDNGKPIVIFDVEVFPNVFIVCWKMLGDNTVFRLICTDENPRRSEIAYLLEHYRLVGFNNRKYDNHIMYAWAYRLYSNFELFIMSQNIIVTKKGEKSTGFIGPAYNASYLDLYDLASNPNKKGLKKWEIQLHAHHQENAYAWDKDLPEDKWNEVADYCENDVRATELVYYEIAGDVAARLILSQISLLLPNDTTNNHSMQIIFGDDMHPQTQFVYTDLSTLFPGYEFKDGVSKYKGIIVGEGGFVWALPGMYRKVKTFDIASMHPSSLIALNLFGDIYTKRFKEIKDARLAVKHKDRESLKILLGGVLLPFYDIAEKGEEYTLKDLANALKTVINSVYGLTCSKFNTRCRDPRNVDNIVAKRGALFMVDLKEEVEKRGGKVIHIKTDSIKVVDPSPELEKFIVDYGKTWGYDFEVESIYDRICLVNDAVYIAKEENGEWTATGAEFAHPYIFKTLFSHEEFNTYDLGEVRNVTTGELYLDFNEGLQEGEHNYQFIGKISEFFPVKDGCGGAEMMAKRGDKYVSVTGTKGIRWMEAEYIRSAHKDDYIDMSYYNNLCDKAISHINEFGDFYRFVNDDDYDPELEKCLNVPLYADEEIPFDEDKVIAA